MKNSIATKLQLERLIKTLVEEENKTKHVNVVAGDVVYYFGIRDDANQNAPEGEQGEYENVNGDDYNSLPNDGEEK